MRNDELITVKEYTESLIYNPAEEASMMRVEDYVASIRTGAVQAEVSSLITVNDYVASLTYERYLTPEEEALALRIEKAVSKKAEKAAQKLDQLLA